MIVRCGSRVALAVGGFLLAWCVILGLTLPATGQVSNWSLAWAGLDGAEGVAALATASLLARGNRRASLTAVAAAALLIADAWFDVCTSSPGPAGCWPLPRRFSPNCRWRAARSGSRSR